MIESLKNVNIMNNLAKYLSYKELKFLSLINKNIYHLLLNPIKNPIINTLYRYFAYKKFYFNDLEDDVVETEKTEEIYDDFNFTKNNWKLIINNLLINYNKYPNKDIVKVIYNCFQSHLFLPGLRKSNKYLEFKNSTLHQQLFYDFLNRKTFTFNYYDKYINENGITKNSNDFILKKSLFFENDIINFNEILLSFKNDNNLIDILEKIIKYDYESLDSIYMNNNNNKFNNNKIVTFLLWLNHTIITFSKFIYCFIILYTNPKNNLINKNKLILEYITKHNDLVNFGLLVDEHFNNINLIIHYLNKFIILKNNKSLNYFSIYKMCMNIFKKEIYDKIKNTLLLQFETISNNYINDLFGEYNNEKELYDNNESKTKEDSNCSDNSDNFSDMDNYDSILDENKEITNKEIIENFMNCITDFNINELNANVINHSELKINEDYKTYENILINSFINKIDNYLLEKDKSFDVILLIIKKTISIQNENINDIQNDENNLNVIKRTKKFIFCKIINHLKEYIIKKIKEEFFIFIDNYNKNNNNNNNIKNKDDKLLKNIISLNYDEKNKLKEEQKNEFLNIYQNEINDITNDLINIINNKKLKNVTDFINIFCNSNNYFVVVLKEIIYFYHIEMGYYSKMDNIIVNILLKGKNNNYPLFINESLKKI